MNNDKSIAIKDFMRNLNPRLFIGIKNHPLRIQIKARSHSISAD
jgi:hypothetical protein